MELHIQLIANNIVLPWLYNLFTILLKGSSEEKLPKLTAGLHHVKVQFIPTVPSPDLQKVIEKSENFMIPIIGIDYVLVLFMHVIEM